MTPKEFIDENYFSLTIDCKREIDEIYKALEDYAKTEQLTLTDVSQQRELLKAYAELIQTNYTNHFFDDAVEESIDQFLSL